MLRTSAVLLAVALSSSVFADTIDIFAEGLGYISMESGSFDILENDPMRFEPFDLRHVNESLAAEGITTDGYLTVLFAETQQGLSMLTLVDDNTARFRNEFARNLDTRLGYRTLNQNMDSQFFLNDNIQDDFAVQESGDQKVVESDWFWSSQTSGEMLAWTNLSSEDLWEVTLIEMGGDYQDVQFLTFSDGSWQILASFGEFGEDGEYCYGTLCTEVIPLPPAIALGMAGLAAVTLRRRLA